MKIIQASIHTVDLPTKGGGYRRTSGFSADSNVSTIFHPRDAAERYSHLAPDNLKSAVSLLDHRSHYGHTPLPSPVML